MAAIWTMTALLGLGAVFKVFPMVYMAAKTAGGAYLLYIAHKMWRNASASINARLIPARHAFRQGFLINLLNPKSVLFAGAVLVTVFPAGISIADSLVIVLNHFLVEIAFYTTLAFCMSTQIVARRYMRAKVYIDRGAAATLGALGLRVLIGRGNVP